MKPEDRIQVDCVAFAQAFVPPPPVGPYYFAVEPLPSKRAIKTAVLAKRMGAKGGVPDLSFMWNGPGRRSFTVEFKAAKGRNKATQDEQFPIIRAAGVPVYIVRSLEEFQAALEAEGVPMTARISA